ncbi:MAG: CPBP family glutamic-type intramembrane protease [Pseudomonadota bacterium]
MRDMQTSPQTKQEIESTFGDGPPPGEPGITGHSLTSEWQRLAVFLKRPSLDARADASPPLLILARIFALDILAMAVLIGAATIAVAAGVYLPETALAGIEFTPLIVLGVIVGAPVMEELVFRSWLSGKPGHVLCVLLIALGALGFGVAHVNSPVIGLLIALGGIIAGIAALILLRHSQPMRWFVWAFPGFFWFTTIAFALVHIANFDMSGGWSNMLILLPLVLPQFILGALLGYVRVQIGLWAAILLHAAHNASALTLAFAAGQLAGG